MKVGILSLSMMVFVLVSCGGGESAPKKKKLKSNASAPVVEQKEEPAGINISDTRDNKGIGPISSVTLAELDSKLAESGKVLFQAKCTACHKENKRLVGPAVNEVLNRRSPEWVMNMILNPDEMLEKDPVAMQLLKEYKSPMNNQGLTEEEARTILEYFRTISN